MATAPARSPPGKLQGQSSILDYVAGDLNRLEGSLGPADRSKLSEYLDAVRDIERRIQKAEEQMPP